MRRFFPFPVAKIDAQIQQDIISKIQTLKSLTTPYEEVCLYNQCIIFIAAAINHVNINVY